MSKAPAIERLDRKPSSNEDVAKACTKIKKWLNSNPSTPTNASFHPGKVEAEDKASPPAEDRHEHGGVSLLSTEDTADTVSPQREPKEKSGHGLAPLTPTSHHSLKETQKPHMGHQNLTVANVPAEKQAPASMPSQVLETIPSSQGQKVLKNKRSMSSWSVSDDADEPLNINDDKKKEVTTCEDVSAFNVASWMLNTTEPPSLTLSFDSPDLVAAYKHDVDPCTGELMPETQYPETLQDHHLGPCRDHKDIAWRQANMTAELHIIRELASREKLAAKLRSQLQPEQKQTLAVGVEEDTWPKAECKLRPATPKDFEHIAKIMNLERLATTCPQVLESKDVTASDIQRIFNACRDNLRPFIVANEGEDELFDRAKWPKNVDKAYRQWVTFKRSQTSGPSTVLGFAFVADARIGFLDTSCRGSRFAGQIKIAVHPDHRRKLYGSALLDRILLSVALGHRSLVDYQWHCPNPEFVYETPSGYNRRQYAWVYVETFCARKDDADSKWRAELLDKFQFKQVAYLPEAVKTDRFYDSQWLDLALWALEVQPRSKIIDRPPGKDIEQ